MEKYKFVVGQSAIIYDDSDHHRIQKIFGTVCTINKKYITIAESLLTRDFRHKFDPITLRGVGDFCSGKLLFPDEDALQDYILGKQLCSKFLKLTRNFEDISLENKKLIIELLTPKTT